MRTAELGLVLLWFWDLYLFFLFCGSAANLGGNGSALCTPSAHTQFLCW